MVAVAVTTVVAMVATQVVATTVAAVAAANSTLDGASLLCLDKLKAGECHHSTFLLCCNIDFYSYRLHCLSDADGDITPTLYR